MHVIIGPLSVPGLPTTREREREWIRDVNMWKYDQLIISEPAYSGKKIDQHSDVDTRLGVSPLGAGQLFNIRLLQALTKNISRAGW